jgi:hypothetical protein
MQYHRLLLDRSLSGTPSVTTTALRDFNGYYVYGNSIGGSTVTPFNVRTFLNDPRNNVIAMDFLAYLTGNTTQSEYVQIVGSNEELANVFNQFYEITVLAGTQTPSNVVENSLVQTVTVQTMEADHLWNGEAPTAALENIPLSVDQSDRSQEAMNTTIKYDLAPGYYISVFITRTYLQDGKDKYDDCPNRISQLMNPEVFVEVDTTIETERIGRAEVTILPSERLRRSTSVFNVNDFSASAQELIARCYGSQCMDNRHCDLLYFSHRRMMEINAIDSQHIQDMLGDTTNGFSSSDVLSVLVQELSMNGYPVRPEVYSCLNAN